MMEQGPPALRARARRGSAHPPGREIDRIEERL